YKYMFLNNVSQFFGLCLLVLLAACTSLPGAGLPSYTSLPLVERPSVNFGARRPNYVVIHHTSDDTAEESLHTLTNPKFEVSSHYLIGRDGKLYYLVDELARAWHAGEAYWGGLSDLNSASIGIELDNNGFEPFAEPMIETLLQLLADLKARYKIPTANFLGHGDIIPGRKVDPSRHFPWKRLAERGFGLWCEAPAVPFAAAPAGASDALLLAGFGYDVSNLNAAVAAFKRRFSGIDSDSALSESDRAQLYCLIQRKMER
ncbi:MAG: N-acetylmuramoyl-L-alanine amidase, partial [Burkholderiales bacterium]